MRKLITIIAIILVTISVAFAENRHTVGKEAFTRDLEVDFAARPLQRFFERQGFTVDTVSRFYTEEAFRQFVELEEIDGLVFGFSILMDYPEYAYEIEMQGDALDNEEAFVTLFSAYRCLDGYLVITAYKGNLFWDLEEEDY